MKMMSLLIVKPIHKSVIMITLVLAQTLLVLAQGGATAQLSGTVTDPDGAAVINAGVTARHKATGFTRTARAGDTGYVLTNLPPGAYEVTVEAHGFAPLQDPSVELTVGQQATLNLKLKVVAAAEMMTVDQSASVVEPTRTELSEAIEERRIQNLPNNGRQLLKFVLLTPNASPGRSDQGDPGRPGEFDQINISFAGLDESASLITVDGANNMSRVFQRSRSALSREAVREFRVRTTGYGAEYGMAAGAVVSIVTKSGANQLRGSVYYFLRNAALDARNILAPQGFDELKQNQFGGTLEGPIVKQRLFLFGNYEGQRREESPFYSTVLLDNLGAINAVKKSLGLPPEVLEGKLRKKHYDSVTLRGDYQARPSDQLSLIYRFRDDRDTNLGSKIEQQSAPSNFRNADIEDNVLVADWTSTHGTAFVNQALFQYSHHTFDYPSVTFEPSLSVGDQFNLGRAGFQPDLTRETMLEFADTVSYVRGAHIMKFGSSINHTRGFLLDDPADPAFVVFPNLDAFLGTFAVVFSYRAGPDGTRPPAPPNFDRPANQGIAIFDQASRASDSQTYFALFAQDQWRATSKLTVNYGLRWDADHLPEAFSETYYNAFQPRLGFAYSMLTDRIVLRAGAGIYQGVSGLGGPLFTRVLGQNPALGPVHPEEFNSVPGALLSLSLEGPANAIPAFLNFIHTGVYPTLAGPDFLPARNFFLTTNRKNPRALYTYQWNAQVDFRLTKEMVLSISYIGVHGLNGFMAYLLNVAPAAFKLSNGKNDYSIAPGVPFPLPRLLNQSVSALSLFFNGDGQSTYHGGTVTLTKRFSQLYSFTANYTWSKAIDNVGNGTHTDAPEDPYRRDLERTRSKQDVPHRFVASFTAEGPEKTLFRDFRLSFIGNISSAQYYTLYAGSDVNNDGNSQSDRVGTLGRNTYRGDQSVNFDVRVSRQFRMSDRVRLEAVAEAFNLFNTLNVTDVNTTYGARDFTGPQPRRFGDKAPAPSRDFAAIRSIAPPRQIQFALRLNF